MSRRGGRLSAGSSKTRFQSRGYGGTRNVSLVSGLAILDRQQAPFMHAPLAFVLTHRIIPSCSNMSEVIPGLKVYEVARPFYLASCACIRITPMAREAVASTRATSSCLSCYRRKLRCDRTIAGCANCTKSQLPCMYETLAKAHQSRLGPRARTGKRGPYKKHATPREKELEHIVQILHSRLDDRESRAVQTRTLSEVLPTSAESGTVAYSQGLVGNVTGINSSAAAADMLQAERELDLADPIAAGSASDGTASVPAPVFVEAAMLASMEPWPSIAESDIFQLWYVFIHRVEPMTKLVHIPSFGPVMLEAARNSGWVVDRGTRLLVASVLFATLSTVSDEDLDGRLRLSKAALTRALRLRLDAEFGDPAVNADSDLHSLQALTLFIV